METIPHSDTDRAFFARLGAAFAVSILVCGVMMFAVGPVPQSDDGAQTALGTLAAADLAH